MTYWIIRIEGKVILGFLVLLDVNNTVRLEATISENYLDRTGIEREESPEPERGLKLGFWLHSYFSSIVF